MIEKERSQQKFTYKTCLLMLHGCLSYRMVGKRHFNLGDLSLHTSGEKKLAIIWINVIANVIRNLL